MKRKIAVDTQISRKIIKSLISKGYDIVLVAPPKEVDEVWVDSALLLGANCIVSPDLDIPLLLDRWGVDDVLWIDVPRHLKSDKLERYLIRRLK